MAGAIGQRFELSADDVLAHPHALIGTTEAIADMIVERREKYGFNRFLVLENLVDSFAPVVAQLAGK